MAFEDIDCVKPKASAAAVVPADGIAVTARKLTRRGGGSETRYIALAIGAELARKISLTLDEHRLRLLFGTGSDAGLVQVSVDNAAGKFVANRNKGGTYRLTINAATAEGLFAMSFAPFVRAGLEALRPGNGKPPHFVFRATPDMLAVED